MATNAFKGTSKVISEVRPHDLMFFMRSLEETMAADYKRIQRRVAEDPGTAGDEGEENWAALLRGWLPATYPVVTKGRIINEQGLTSPQVDVLVLKPFYPIQLRNTKHYLVAGVAAAFECKLTLRTADMKRAFRTARHIKNLIPARRGTPYKELTRPIIYGVLCHHHSWRPKENGLPRSILDSINKGWVGIVEKPHELVDIICIATTATFSLSKKVCIFPHVCPNDADMFKRFDRRGGVLTAYFAQSSGEGKIIGSLIAHLTHLMAREDPSLRNFSHYLFGAQPGVELGAAYSWNSVALSAPVVRRLAREGYAEDQWSEWNENVG
jgi:hypothetical protein